MVRVVFLHPDLGLGGAERLVVDAALALISKGHQVVVVTSHHDPDRCFPETAADGPVPVLVSGAWLPRSLFGRFLAVCAYLRMIWAALYVVFAGPEADVYFCDQVSACVPVLRSLRRRTPVLFYCHFPDLLLADHGGRLRRLYRAPLDWVEERTTGAASAIVVNSRFTAGVFRDTFRTLRHQPQVLHPSLHLEAFDRPVTASVESVIGERGAAATPFLYLSINRYERKKNLALALRAFALVRAEVGADAVHLVMAGGYDRRVVENVEHFDELQRLADELDVATSVTWLRSPDDDVKRALLRHSRCLVYTPDREHFGIVPLEAMYCAVPVVAVNSGGPLETVDDGVTGYLCPPQPVDFAQKMSHLFHHRQEAEEMGRQGRARVLERFSFRAFSDQLDALITDLLVSQ